MVNLDSAAASARSEIVIEEMIECLMSPPHSKIIVGEESRLKAQITIKAELKRLGLPNTTLGHSISMVKEDQKSLIVTRQLDDKEAQVVT